MKCTGALLGFFAAAVLAVAISASFSLVYAQDAMGQLENASNTGTLFDGSDGDRFGTDTEIDASGSVPDVPPPTKVETSTDTDAEEETSDDTAAAQSSSDDSGSEDSSEGDDSESETDGASGFETAE